MGSQTAAEERADAHTIALADLAAEADVVALAQARDTDYVYRREFPYRGSAYLKVLIPYRGGPLPDIIEVYEEGLHEHECYFPNPSVFEEGRRYLLFLRRDPEKEGRYRGMPLGCALDVLVTADNRYAVRMPADGIALSDPLAGLAEAMPFADSYASETNESLPPDRRNAWLQDGYLAADGERFRYTQGIDLTEIRRLMAGGLK